MSEHGITLEDVYDTLQRATDLIKPYRGKIAFRNKIVKLSMVAAGLLTLFLAVMIGMMNSGNYLTPMVIVVIYLVTFVTLVTIFKYRSSYAMRMS